ncbi:hypothetical protein IFM89_026526 [Coptis chinensis]|uniref:Uncharacterized protein n=1 Tax=Coptis chinensis TaxID=261450 RepID=A0A835MAP3_9MAGN|nr:hypothetical protein IFM89_026526 [Coptis chinensis]
MPPREKILPFSCGRSGLYIEGSVSPPISGVDIRVVTADNSGGASSAKGELVLETTNPNRMVSLLVGLYMMIFDYEIEASKISKLSPSSVDVVWGLGTRLSFKINWIKFLFLSEA